MPIVIHPRPGDYVTWIRYICGGTKTKGRSTEVEVSFVIELFPLEGDLDIA